MQYYRPETPFFVGDCMPFYHDGVYHLYYLRDENHHGARGGLGGHQWAHASTEDLIQFTHHPLAIGITEGWEGSICTGSVFYHDGVYYGFYATRLADWRQEVYVARSDDGIVFTKENDRPLAIPPPDCHPNHYRDPVVFRDPQTGLFHMLVTALLTDFDVTGLGGCLAHLVSRDLTQWQVDEPFIVPGLPGVPECPDYFLWNGWYYLLFSNGGLARYRMSRHPLGPWIRPCVDELDGGGSRVMKTAAFTGNRRIGVSWLFTRVGDSDTGNPEFGGNAVFRELIQLDDGTLGTRFPPEMIPAGSPLDDITPTALTGRPIMGPRCIRIDAEHGLHAAAITTLPHNIRLTARMSELKGAGVAGLRIRHGIASGYDLRFDPIENTVRLNSQTLTRVDALNGPFDLDVIVTGSIIDVCIDHTRCLIDRCPEQSGPDLLFYARDASVSFRDIQILALS